MPHFILIFNIKQTKNTSTIVNSKNKIRALVLMSGGLDSILALKMLQKQGIGATPICFESYFFSCDNAKIIAKENGINLRIVNISEPHLEIVKHPRFGRGAAMNPCVDCHLLMLKIARKIMGDESFDFIATGEVIGQRPMSQNKQSLDVIEKEVGLAGKILRPLSAKLLARTEAETQGLVDENKLYGISGRSRKPQLELAKKFGIKKIPQPAGGCVLADADYGKKLKELMKHHPEFNGADAQVLRFGRPFWEEKILFIVARNKDECEKLNKLAQAGDMLFEPQNFPGPTVLARDFDGQVGRQKIEEIGKNYLLRYSKKIPSNPEITVNYPKNEK